MSFFRFLIGQYLKVIKCKVSTLFKCPSINKQPQKRSFNQSKLQCGPLDIVTLSWGEQKLVQSKNAKNVARTPSSGHFSSLLLTPEEPRAIQIFSLGAKFHKNVNRFSLVVLEYKFKTNSTSKQKRIGWTLVFSLETAIQIFSLRNKNTRMNTAVWN